MKPIIILYSPDEDALNDAYSQGYRIVGVVYVPERGTRVYMQVVESLPGADPADSVLNLFSKAVPPDWRDTDNIP